MPAALDSSSRFLAPADSDASASSSFSVADAAAIVSERRAGRRARRGRGTRETRDGRGREGGCEALARHVVAERVRVVISRSKLAQTSPGRSAIFGA